MMKFKIDISSQRGSTKIKVLLVFLVLALLFNAGINYIPVAYNGASFKQEMDTAVVKGLAAVGGASPAVIVKNHVEKARVDYNIPPNAVIVIKPTTGGVATAHVTYNQEVNLLPFGLYKYNYAFNHLATPTGYLIKQ